MIAKYLVLTLLYWLAAAMATTPAKSKVAKNFILMLYSVALKQKLFAINLLNRF